MEGLHELPRAVPKPKSAPRAGWIRGYGLALLVAALSYAIHYLPFPPFQVGNRYPVSAAIIAILGGVIVRNVLPLPAASVDAAKGLARRLIPLTIVLTG